MNRMVSDDRRFTSIDHASNSSQSEDILQERVLLTQGTHNKSQPSDVLDLTKSAVRPPQFAHDRRCAFSGAASEGPAVKGGAPAHSSDAEAIDVFLNTRERWEMGVAVGAENRKVVGV